MVSFCASCPCYILSWWRMSRASCGANGRLSIYIVPSRLLRLAFASRFYVSWRRLVVLLVSSSRRRLLVVASCRFIFSVLSRFCPCVLLVADAVAMSSVGRLMSVASRRERLVAFLRLVSRFVHRFVFISRLVLSCRHPWRGGGSYGGGRGVDALVIIWSGAVGVLLSYSDWLGMEMERG